MTTPNSGNNSQHVPPGANLGGLNNNVHMTQAMQHQIQSMQMQMQQQMAIMHRQQAQIQSQRAELEKQTPGTANAVPKLQQNPLSAGAPSNTGGGLAISGIMGQQGTLQHSQGVNNWNQNVSSSSATPQSGSNVMNMNMPNVPNDLLGGTGGGQSSTMGINGPNSSAVNSNSSVAGSGDISSKAMLMQQLQLQQYQQMQQQQQQRGGLQSNDLSNASVSGSPGSSLGLNSNSLSGVTRGGDMNMVGSTAGSGSVSQNPAMLPNMAPPQPQRQLSRGVSGSNVSVGLGMANQGAMSGHMSQSNSQTSLHSLQSLQGNNAGMMVQNVGVNNSADGNNQNQQFPMLPSGQQQGALGGNSQLNVNMMQQLQHQQQLLALKNGQGQQGQGHHQQLNRSQSDASQQQGVVGSLGGNNSGLSLRGSFNAGQGTPNLMPMMGGMANANAQAKTNGQDAFNGSTPNSAVGGMSGAFGSGQSGATARGSFPNNLNQSQAQLSQSQMFNMLQQQQKQMGGASVPPFGSGTQLPAGAQQHGLNAAGASGAAGFPFNSAGAPGAAGKKDASQSGTSSGGSDTSDLPDLVGGWQNNSDLPDRRKVIVNIVKIIGRMRPDTNKNSSRLPLMAKKLEEHLYRSAATKEEYVDPTTLKRRLQSIANRLGLSNKGASGSSSMAPGVDPKAAIGGDDASSKDGSSKTSITGRRGSKTGAPAKSPNHQALQQPFALQQQLAAAAAAAGLKSPSLDGVPGQGSDSSAASGGNETSGAQSNFPTSSTAAAAFMKMNLHQIAQQQALLQQATQGANPQQKTQNEALLQHLQVQQSQIQALMNSYGNGQGQKSGSDGNNGGGNNASMNVMGQQHSPQLQTMQKQQQALLKMSPDTMTSQQHALSELQKNMRQAHNQQQQQNQSIEPGNIQSQPNAGGNMAAPRPSVPQLPSMAGMLDGKSQGGVGATGAKAPNSASSDQSDPAMKAQRQKVIKQQQHRLLLLHHASKCTDGPNCRHSFCPEMTKLWQHIRVCRDNQCSVAHCTSSKCVMHHYRLCKVEQNTNNCEVCAPVMQQIKLANDGRKVGSNVFDPVSGGVRSGKDGAGAEDEVDLMEQLAKEHELQGATDAFSTNSGAQTGVNNSNSGTNNGQVGIQGQTPQQQAPQQQQQQQQQQMQQQLLPNGSPSANARGNPSLYQVQMQALLQQQQQQQQQKGQQSMMGGGMNVPGSGQQGPQTNATPVNVSSMQGGAVNRMGMPMGLMDDSQVQQGMSNQQSMQLSQDRQHGGPGGQSCLSVPLSQHQQQQQRALLQQLQVQQRNFLMQLQRKSVVSQPPGSQPGAPDAAEVAKQQFNLGLLNDGTQTDVSMNIEPIASQPQIPEDTASVSSEVKPKKQRRGSTTRKRKAAGEYGGKGGKRVSQGKGKRLGKIKKEGEKTSSMTGEIVPLQVSSDQVKGEAEKSDPSTSKAGPTPNGSVPSSDEVTSGGSSITNDKSNLKEDKKDEGATSPTVEEVASSDTNQVAKIDRKVDSIPEKNASNENNGAKDEKSGAPSTASSKDVSLVSTMSTDAIEQHLSSLHENMHINPRKIAQKCLPIVTKLINDPNGWVFKDPVDPEELGIPDYFDVITNPMDLSLVKSRLEEGVYKNLESFEKDTKLVFENCILYNGEDSDVGGMAKSLLSLFNREFKVVLKGMKAVEKQQLRKHDVCSLCDCSRKHFEPTVLYCNGACGMQRIRRNAMYYADPCKLNHWCVPCYGLLKESDPILLDDGNEVRKADLQKLKNDALAEEGWVECDECHSWVHQICALFNGRKNKTAVSYRCPKCHIKQREADALSNKTGPKACVQGAKDLPHCKVSIAIENGVKKALQEQYERKAKEKKCNVRDVEKVEGLCVRVVSNMEKKHVVRDEMYNRYRQQGFPSEFPVRSKCILLFQSIHGVDVVLFGVYVYEYNHECPAPNRRRVYISYLDSVNYFSPPSYRTLTYHTILVEYLRLVKDRGFHTAHIWSCPPSKGDDYVFYCHPSRQKTPRGDMLVAWYHSMIDKAKAEGIVLDTRTLYDEYFKSDGFALSGVSVDGPTCLPYFEGDYVPGEVENIIKEISKEEDDRRKERKSLTVKVRSSSEKPAGNKLGTRSNPGELVNVGPDKVMLRLGQALCGMKDNFLVLHLRSRAFAAAVERGDDVSQWVEDDKDVVAKGRAGGKDASVLGDRPKKVFFSGTGINGQAEAADQKKGDRAKEKMKLRKQGSSGSLTGKSGDGVSQGLKQKDIVNGVKCGVKKFIRSTADDDPPQESEFFDSRQQFLNYCTANHFQFDELRKAKHTTMMILYHLHNPAAPKFLQQCGSCYREITHGIRYRCNDCSNFDLCHECYEPVVTGLWAKRDSRFAHDKNHSFTPIDMEAKSDTQKSRDDRETSIRRHLELLQHCASCAGAPKCSSHNCNRMRGLFTHLKTCKTTYRNGCKICSRFLALLTMHARQCSLRHSESCKIPYCDPIRERSHRLRQQQQLMDDRRRAAQNERARRTQSA